MQVDTLGYTITIDTAQIQDAMKKFEQAFKETENYMRSTFGPDFEKVWNGITAKITDTGKEIKSNISINTALQADLPKAQEMLTNFFERIKQEAEKAGVAFKSVTGTLRDIEYQKIFKEMSGRASTLQKDFANLNNTINKIGESFSTKGFTNFLNIDEFDAKVNTFQTKLNELKSVFADLTPEKAVKLFTEENFTEVSNKVKDLKASYLELRNEEEIHQKVLKEQTRLEDEHQKQMEKVKQSISNHNQALSEQIKNQERELDIIKNRQAGAEWEKRQKEEAAIRKQAEAQAELTKQQQQELDILKWKQKYGSQATIPYNYDTIAKTDVAGKFKEISSSANEAYFNVNSLIYAVTRLSYFLGITLSFQKVISEIEDFNVKMNSTFKEIWSLMDVTEEKMGTFQQSFLTTFKNAAVTFQDIFEGARLAASSGIDFEELLPFSQIAEKVAVAGKTEMKTVIDTFTSYIDAYQGKVEDLNKVSNAMFQGVKYGKETFEQLNTSLGKLIPVAAQAGVSMEEVIAGISTLTRVGVSPKQSSTQISRIIQDIIQPTSEAQKMAAMLGVQFDSLALKSKGLYGFLNDLKTALQANSKTLEQMGFTPVEALGKLFNRAEALRGSLALTGTASELFGKILSGVSSQVDVISEAYDKNSQSLESIDARIQNTVDHMKSNFEPVVKSVKLATEGLVGVFDAFVSTADPALLTISGVGVALSLLIPIVGNVIDLFKKLGTTMSLTFKFTGWGLAISAITAIGSLIAGSIIKSQEKVIDNNQKIEKTTSDIINEVRTNIDNITMKISDVNTQIIKTTENAKEVAESFKTLEQEVIDYNYAFENGLTTVETHQKAIDTLIEKFPMLKTAIEKSAEGYLVFNDNIKNVIELQLTMLENQKKIAENSLQMAKFELAQMEANPNIPELRQKQKNAQEEYTKLQANQLSKLPYIKDLTQTEKDTIIRNASDVDEAYNLLIKILKVNALSEVSSRNDLTSDEKEKIAEIAASDANKAYDLLIEKLTAKKTDTSKMLPPPNSEKSLRILLPKWEGIYTNYEDLTTKVLEADNAILQAKNTIASRQLEIEKTTSLISEMKKIPDTLKTTTTSGIPSTTTAKTEKLSTYEMNESDLNKQVEDYVKKFEKFKDEQPEWSKETLKDKALEYYEVLSSALTSVLQEERKAIQERVLGNIKVGLTPKDVDLERLAKLTSYEQTYLFTGPAGINTKEQDIISDNLENIELYKKYLDTITGDSLEELEETKNILSKISSMYENIKQVYIEKGDTTNAVLTEDTISSYSGKIKVLNDQIQEKIKSTDRETLKKQIENMSKNTVFELETYKNSLEDLKGFYTTEKDISEINNQIADASIKIQRLTSQTTAQDLKDSISKFSSDPLMQEEVLKLYDQRSEILWELVVDYFKSGMKEEYKKVATEFEENIKAKTAFEQQAIIKEIQEAEKQLKTLFDNFDIEKSDALFTIEKIKETFKDISGLYKKISDEARAFDYEQSLKAWENSYNDYLKKIEIEKMITLSDESFKNINNYVEGTADWILAVKSYLESLKNLDKMAGTDSSATIKQWEMKILETEVLKLKEQYEQNYTNEAKKPYILEEYRQSLEILKRYYNDRDKIKFNRYTDALDDLDFFEAQYEKNKQLKEEQEKREAEIGRIDLLAGTLDEIEELSDKLSKAQEISKSYEKLGETEKASKINELISQIEMQLKQNTFEDAKKTFETNKNIMDTVLLQIYADNYIKAYEAIATDPTAQANVKRLSEQIKGEIKTKETSNTLQNIFKNLEETLIKLPFEDALKYTQKISETYSDILSSDQKNTLNIKIAEISGKIDEQTKTKALTKIEKMQTDIASTVVESAFDATIKLDKINEMLKEINSFAAKYGLTESLFNLRKSTEKQKSDIDNFLNLETFKTEIEQVFKLESKLTEKYNTIQQKFDEAKTLNAEARTWEELSTDADMLIEMIQNELELIPEVTGYAKEIIEIVKKSLQGKATDLKGISLASDLRSKLSDIQIEDFEFNFNDFFDTLIQNNFNFSSYLEKLQQQIEKLNEQKEKIDKVIKESSEGSEERNVAESEKEKIENTVKEIDKTKTKLENAQKKFENDFMDFLLNISGMGSEASGIIKGIVETVQLSMTNAPEAIFSAFGVALKIITAIANTAQESAKNAKKIKDELAEKDFLSGKTSRTAEFEKFKKDREKEIEETLAKIKNIRFNDFFGFLKYDEFNALMEKLKKLQEDTAEDTQNKFADIYGLDIDSIASIVESAFDSVDISQFNENIEMSLKQAVKKAIIQAMIDSLISSTAMKRVIEIIQQLVKTPSDPELLKRLKEETSKASELLASTFTPIFEMLKNTFPEVFGQVNTAVEAVGAVLSEETGNKIVGVFSTLSSSQQRFNTLFEKYIDKASQMLETIELTLTELKAENKENTEEIKNKIQEIIDKIENDFTINIDLKPITDNLLNIKEITATMNESFAKFKTENWQTVDLILANINTIKGYIFDIREKLLNGIIKVETQTSTKIFDVSRAIGG